MEQGMLWFDDDKHSELPQKVEQAAAYYRKKYGQMPNMCYINPKMLPKKGEKIAKVALKASPVILPHHFWIGVDED